MCLVKIKKSAYFTFQFIFTIICVTRYFLVLFIGLTIFVRTRFVTNHNSVGFTRKKAQTISFVERGFERLGLGHQAVGFS